MPNVNDDEGEYAWDPCEHCVDSEGNAPGCDACDYTGEHKTGNIAYRLNRPDQPV